MQAFKVEPFNIWANSKEEVDEMRQAFIDFIEEHGRQGRFVTARKITDAVKNWKGNFLVKSKIIEHFSN